MVRDSPWTAGLAATAAGSTVAAVAAALYYLSSPSGPAGKASSQVEKRRFDAASDPSIAELEALTAQRTRHTTYPLAHEIVRNVPVYRAADFALGSGDARQAARVEQLKDELYHILTAGPGTYVIRGFMADGAVIDAANAAFAAIAAREAETGGGGDHFAAAATNVRIWNAFQKQAEQDPAGFAAYYGNAWFDVVCDSYLGPGWRATAQVNTVRPGGAAQTPHRDYHLGFQSAGQAAAWPRAVHDTTAILTLQGAVAHTDMPLASGPTRLLPFSQVLRGGYCCFRRPEFVEHFQRHHVALALEKGDALFFSPALLHAAGENVTADFDRTANLLQVSSAFGKPMETIDTLAVIEKTYDEIAAMFRAEGMSVRTDAIIRAVGEGYPFPTNLDCRQPGPGGMAPESEQDILRRNISDGRSKADAMRELTDVRVASSASGKQAA